jgi:hypothetical protein
MDALRPRSFLPWLSIAAVAGALGLAACSAGPSDAGTSVIAFALPNGWNLDTVTYAVWGADSELLVSGTEDVGNSNATLSLSAKLPPGHGDVLVVTATTAGATACRGTSQPFDVTAGMPTFIGLALNCGSGAAGADSCPFVSIQAPNPAEAAAPAGTIGLVAAASDADPEDVLSFSWAADAGSFSDSGAPSTQYICTAAGAETIVLTVDDHHAPTSCQVTFLLPVSCLPDGGSD